MRGPSFVPATRCLAYRRPWTRRRLGLSASEASGFRVKGFMIRVYVLAITSWHLVKRVSEGNIFSYVFSLTSHQQVQGLGLRI